jgi:hypothetical protein
MGLFFIRPTQQSVGIHIPAVHLIMKQESGTDGSRYTLILLSNSNHVPSKMSL